MTTAPYGSWVSPVSIEMLTAGSVDLTAGGIDNGVHYWAQRRASDGGRTSVWKQPLDGEPTEVTPDHNVGTMVHEYGGAAWTVNDGVVVFSDKKSHGCFVVRDGEIDALTPADSGFRYANFQLHPEHDLVLAVREDHRESDLDCVNTIVALNLRSGNDDGGRVIAEGADFYAAPTLHNDGRIAWIEWDHPNMPWDSTRLMTGVFDPQAATVNDLQHLAGTETSAPCYPGWVGDELVFLDDPSGFWNFHAVRGGSVVALHNEPFDYCYPAWVFGSAWSALDDGRILCAPIIDGAVKLGIFDGGTFTALPTDSVAGSIGGPEGSRVPIFEVGKDYPPRVRILDVETNDWTLVNESLQVELDPAFFSVAEAVSWDSPLGEVHAFYYPPTNPNFTAPEGERPPLKVLSHGGPTGFSMPRLDLRKQYWTSRGWGILDVNYGGSAGYGRAYRERLQGTWGVTDVQDCADGALAMVDRGLADRDRLAIEGGSAGGYTTLAALTSSDVFTAGNCLYGIGELAIMARETHKFESRYLFGLLGGTPDEVPEVYKERSPIFHLDQLSCPMLIQQGEDDRVVPPNQAVMMADAVRDKGLPVALLMFPGEGHGFLKAENIQASLEGALSFFGQVFGYVPADVPTLPVENL